MKSSGGLLPNFFLLGAAKAGTSSLYSYLYQHPETCLSSVKEPYFFNDGLAYKRGNAWYVGQYFSHCDADHLRGEATPMLHLPAIAGNNILRTYGRSAEELKFVVVLRDPVERAWSHYLNRRRLTAESEDFETALAQEDERLAADPADWCGYFNDGLYAEQLEAWFSMFDASQFLILRHDDLHVATNCALARICQFLSIDDTFAFNTDMRSNVASGARSPTLMRLIGQPPEFVRFAARLLMQQRTRKRLRATLRSWLSVPYHEKPEMDLSTASWLRARYQADISKLEMMTGLDFSAWREKKRT
jgi:hypothetical protein